jgi:hypothetical protein
MPLTKNKATINEGYEDQFDLIETMIPNLSYRYEYRNFVNDKMGNDEDYYVSDFIENTVRDTMDLFIDRKSTFRIKIEVGGEYEQFENPHNLTFWVRNSSDVYDKRNNLELTYKLTNPSIYFDRIGIDGDLEGSKAYSNIKTIDHMTIHVIKIHDYNTNAVTTRHTLIRSNLNNYISFIPINEDNLCILHCVYAKLNNMKGSKQFYNLERCLNEFNIWVDDNDLLPFYDEIVIWI